MTTEQLITNMSDDAGRLTWWQALTIAEGHCLRADFVEDWQACSYDDGISAAKFAHWLGY